MKRNLITLITSILITLSASAQTQSEVLNVLNLISKSDSALKTTNDNCLPGTKDNCTLESLCSQAAKNSDKLVLIKDSSGREIPNYNLQNILNLGELCDNGSRMAAITKDPFIYPLALFDEAVAGGPLALADNKIKYKQAKARSEKIFKDAKEKVLAVLQARSSGSPTPELQNMIQRIRNTTFEVKDFNSPEELYAAGCSSANAFNDTENSVVHICPQFLNYPDATLFAILAHEIGHSIDPCASAYDMIDGKMPTRQLTEKELKSSKFLPGMSLSKNPLKSVISCLMSPKSINVKAPSKEEALKRIDDRAQATLAERSENEEPNENGEVTASDAFLAQIEDEKNTVLRFYDTQQFCEFISGSGHVGEATADWVSSQAVSLKLKEFESSAQAKEYSWMSSAAFLGTECPAVKEAAKNIAEKGYSKSCLQKYPVDKVLNFENTETAGHPNAFRRINKVHFAQPDIKKTLGCQGGEDVIECK